MSSIDQAFVKAFARRSRPSHDAQAVSGTPDQTSGELGEVQVDPSVARSAQIWIDPTGDQVLRSDIAAEPPIPDPHHAVARTPIRPSEHFRSDYVFGAIEEVMPAAREVESGNTDIVPESEADSAESEMSAVNDPSETAESDALETDDTAVSSTEEETAAEVAEDSIVDTDADANSIEAAWEVDMFEIPATTADLFFDEDVFRGIAERMREAVDDGLRSLVVTSAQSGEGRSTVAIGIAVAAAATGLKVALVDGDTEDPTLADDLRLDLEYGWVDAIRNGSPLGQVVVQSVEDGVTLFPLVPAQENARGATAAEVQQLMDALNDRFDLIVVDGPSCAMPRIHQFAALVDTAIIARDASRTDSGTINELSYRLRQSGAKGVGVVDNFN